MIGENFALNLLRIHVKVLAKNLFCIYVKLTIVYIYLKLTAEFALCNVKGPLLSRKFNGLLSLSYVINKAPYLVVNEVCTATFRASFFFFWIIL